MTQFDTWQAVLGIFICLNIIQFVIGSYVERRLSGTILSISPFVVLFTIFFWTFLWGYSAPSSVFRSLSLLFRSATSIRRADGWRVCSVDRCRRGDKA